MRNKILLDPTVLFWGDSLFELGDWIDNPNYLIPKSVKRVSDKLREKNFSTFLLNTKEIEYDLRYLLNFPLNEELSEEINFSISQLEELTGFSEGGETELRHQRFADVCLAYLIWPNREYLKESGSKIPYLEENIIESISERDWGMIEWINYQIGNDDLHEISSEIVLFISRLIVASLYLGELEPNINYVEMCESKDEFQHTIREHTKEGVGYLTKASTDFLHHIPGEGYGEESLHLSIIDESEVIKKMGPIKRFKYFIGEKIEDIKEKEKKEIVSKACKNILSLFPTIIDLSKPTTLGAKGVGITIEYIEEAREWSKISSSLVNVASSTDETCEVWWKRNIKDYIVNKDAEGNEVVRPEKLKELIKSLRKWYENPLVMTSTKPLNTRKASIQGLLPSHYDDETIRIIQERRLIPALKNFLSKENIYSGGETIIPFLKPWYGQGFIRRTS